MKVREESFVDVGHDSIWDYQKAKFQIRQNTTEAGDVIIELDIETGRLVANDLCVSIGFYLTKPVCDMLKAAIAHVEKTKICNDYHER